MSIKEQTFQNQNIQQKRCNQAILRHELIKISSCHFRSNSFLSSSFLTRCSRVRCHASREEYRVKSAMAASNASMSWSRHVDTSCYINTTFHTNILSHHSNFYISQKTPTCMPNINLTWSSSILWWWWLLLFCKFTLWK